MADKANASYFDAARCPVCGVPRAGEECGGCGISYADTRVSELGRILLQADALRGDLLRQPRRTPPRRTPRDRTPPHQAAAPGPGPAGRAPAQSPSVGWILLGVGALCLAVAAGIFIAVTWDTLGWFVRGLIMLGVTGVFAALTEVTRRKQLRASAETLAAVTGVLWTGTLIASARLLPGSAWWTALIGLLMLFAALVADRWHAHHRDRLRAVDALAAIALPVLFGGASVAAGERQALVSMGAVVAATAAHLRWFRGRLIVTRGVLLAIGALAAAGLAAQGLIGLAGEALVDGWRVLFVITALGALTRLSAVRLVRRAAAAVAGALAAGALLALTGRLPFETAVWVMLALTVPGLLTWLGARGHGELTATVRSAGLGWLVPPGVFGLGFVLVTLARMVPGPGVAEPGPLWMLSTIGFIGLGLVAAVVRTQRRQRSLRAFDAGLVLGAWTVSLVLVYGSYPIALAVLAPAFLGLLALAARTGRRVPFWCAVALAVWLWSLVAAGGWIAPTALLVVGLAALGWGYGRWPLRVGALIVGWLALPAVLLLLNEPLRSLGFDAADANAVCAVLVAVLAGAVLATHQWWWLDHRARVVTEIAALFWAAAAALIALAVADRPTTALCLLVFGVALVVAGQPPERRAYAWSAIGVLTLASWTWLMHQGVTLVEWYTLPTAAVLLAIGTRTLRRDRAASSWRTLLPGLLFGVLPSTTLALSEPISIRALIVGVAAVALILVGLVRHLAACFVVGAIVLALLAVVELWPYAAYVPRWAGFAAAGVLLVAIGVRWEARLRDLKRMGGYLRGLR
ncbi:SCO7613 C-terminal domain-containing membrane protein [Granulicoccus sp. GXG6511]|uniref:SCO7613 C-terminal domain-containing membrane protein n=1 Tax=Granulicoccus sp. GXG6511 TaxID=3381351 RepID=UPI003D7EA1D3